MRVKFKGCTPETRCEFCGSAFGLRKIASGELIKILQPNMRPNDHPHIHYLVENESGMNCAIDKSMVITKFLEHKERLCK